MCDVQSSAAPSTCVVMLIEEDAMDNIQPPGDLMRAVATIEANGASVFQSPVGGQYIVVTPGIGRRDGFSAAAIIRMAQDLKAPGTANDPQ